jgi:flagellar hook protein FlgE
MLRSMYSGIGGMRNFQTKLDVIGNNIANVNTYGFKKGRTTFKDMVSQQISGASGPRILNNIQTGGTNPKQVGLGSQLATIDTIHTQGSLQTTGRPLDLSISGDGFFVLGKGNNVTGQITEEVYTRAGNFYLDVNGNIVNADGLYVAAVTKDPVTGNVTGIQAPITIPTNAKSFSIGSDGTVTYVDANGNLTTAGQIAIAKFANPDGLEKTGANNFKNTPNSGTAQYGTAGGATGAGTIVAGTLEMSNVDLSEEFTEMIVAQRGFQANTRIITTSDQILEELVNLKR